MKILITLSLLVILIGIFLYFLTSPVWGALKKNPEVNIPVSEARLKADVIRLCTTSKPRNSENLDALNEAAEYIKDEFKQAGFNPEEQKFIAGGKEYKNIICSYGPDSAQRIIVGAHYDVCEEQQGADDNASGIAGLLEIARMLDSLKPNLKYRIDLLAYTLEEPPFFRSEFMGSAVHARYIIDNKIPFKAMICLEMIGYYTDEPKSQEYPVKALKAIYPSVGNFIAVVGRTGENDLVKDIKRRMLEGSEINVESINAPASMTGIDFSDHLNYWKYDLPAVMITNTSFYRNKNYHQATDTWETLDYKRMTETVKGIYWAVVNLE